jgi:predicted dehydrogenase
MIEAAATGGSVLAVGLVRRYYPAASFVKDLLDDGVLGPVVRVDAREGAVFGWQVVSDATFRRDQGGGVLTDIGSHVLDLLGWWLGDPVEVAYADDAMGGVEAECTIDLTLAGGVREHVELSRTRLLRNTIRIEGERGRIEIGPGFDPEVRLDLGGRGRSLGGRVAERGRPRPARLEELFAAQLADFARAIDDVAKPLVDGVEGRRSIALVEACRRVRRPLDLPWLRPDAAPRAAAAVP